MIACRVTEELVEDVDHVWIKLVYNGNGGIRWLCGEEDNLVEL